MPASGASTTRFGMRTGPMWKGSVRAGSMRCVEGSCVGGSAAARELHAVALMQELQPRQREQVVHLVDRLRERDDVAGQPARRDRLGLLAHLGAQPADDRV